jgi:hypothetical protein
MVLFVSPSAAWADDFGGRAWGSTFGCSSGIDPYVAPGLGVEGRSDQGFCDAFVPNGTSSARSQANTFSSLNSQISGAVSSNSLGTTATALAQSFDTVTIYPPPGSPVGAAAEISAGDDYTISISNANTIVFARVAGSDPPENVDEFSVARVTIEVSLNPSLTFPPTGSVVRTTDGTFHGLIFTPTLTVLACPCDVVMQLFGLANVVDGASADFHDAPFLMLPPGWTYTFASETSTVPEPTSVLLLIAGLSVLGIAVGKR